MSEQAPFWQTKKLEEMTRPEWESLCDGCAKCCLNKFIDDDETTEETELLPTNHINEGEQIYYTNIACHLLNEKSCQCSKYASRKCFLERSNGPPAPRFILQSEHGGL